MQKIDDRFKGGEVAVMNRPVVRRTIADKRTFLRLVKMPLLLQFVTDQVSQTFDLTGAEGDFRQMNRLRGQSK